MAQEKLFFVGVKGIIENDQGEMLLLLADVSKHRQNTEPYWDIPGGRITEGSDVLATLKREVEEETGIVIKGRPKFLTAVVSNHRVPIDEAKWAGLVLMVYKVQIPAGSQIVISDEHSEYKWFDKAEAAERLQHKYPKEFTDVL